MDRNFQISSAAWKAACRCSDAGEFLAAAAQPIRSAVNLRQIIMFRLDMPNESLELVGQHLLHGRGWRVLQRVVLTGEMHELLTWAGRRLLTGGSERGIQFLRDRIAAESRFDSSRFGPLWGGDELLGVICMVLEKDEILSHEQETLLADLLEPFAAAMENERRIHELRALRETAEADRRSLMRKLGRDESPQPIIGAEQGLRHTFERVETVGRSDVPVLLLGETGAGKEVVARAIHDRSDRRGRPFIRVNCGAIPPELIDSQLFGHERGSFTGAVNSHHGWFERADRGTLFLDEIGELPHAAQVRLLRVLQDGFIERVGGRNAIHVDVRIVAATHRDLAAMVRDGQFRQDLWYRIAVFPIVIPPLRERSEDVPALARHFAERAAIRFGLPPVMPGPDDLRQLIAYPWPGNVRELAAVIDRAALLGNGRRLEIGKALGVGGVNPTPDASPFSASQGIIPSGSLDEIMRAHIEQALRDSHGRIEGRFGAARRLEVNPHTLRGRMRRLGIDWKRYR